MRRSAAVACALACVVLAGLLAAGPVGASWNGDGSGHGYSKANSLPTMTTPTTGATGRNVTVSWTAPGGSTPVSEYRVRRYNTSNAEQTILAGCSGAVTGTSCTEQAVPAGTWRYSVTAARGNWRGTESAKSSNVTIAAPSLSLSTTTVNSLPATLNGSIANFATGQNVTFRLDNATTGTVLSGSTTPSTVPTNGSANVSVTIPAGTSNGSHTVFAIGSAGDQASRAITVTTPTVSASTIQKTAGGDPAFIGANKNYYVYANVTGSGSPPAGFGSLTANVGNVTPGTTAAPMEFGSFTVNGTAYNYRSAQLTSSSSLTAGSKSYSLLLTDTGGSTKTTNHTVTADVTAPSANAVQTTNVSGGTAGLAQQGDTLVLTYNEQMDANSILAGWAGTSTPVVVRLNNAASDTVEVYNSTNSALLPLGSVSLGRADYTSAAVTFGATGTASTMVRSSGVITITLGTPSASATTAAGTGTMSWTPSSTATDRAGNAASTTARAEAGAADVDF